jgi:hypothetical protein
MGSARKNGCRFPTKQRTYYKGEIMKNPIRWWFTAVCLAGLFPAGCGHVGFEESRIIQVTSPGYNQPTYYKLEVRGSAYLAKTHYRAGLYDAAAVDALTGQITANDEPGNIDYVIWSKRRKAVEDTFDDFYSMLEEEEGYLNEDKINEYRERIDLVLQSPYELALSDRQKFLAVFSANASVVAQAVAEFMEDKQSEDVLMMAIAGDKRRDFITEKARREKIDHIYELLRQAQNDLKDPKNLSEDKKNVVAVNDILKDIASIDLP